MNRFEYKSIYTADRKYISGEIMIFENLEKIIGFFGIVIGIEIIAGLIFVLSLLYLRNQQIAGIIGSFSSMSLTCALITFFLKKDG